MHFSNPCVWPGDILCTPKDELAGVGVMCCCVSPRTHTLSRLRSELKLNSQNNLYQWLRSPFLTPAFAFQMLGCGASSPGSPLDTLKEEIQRDRLNLRLGEFYSRAHSNSKARGWFYVLSILQRDIGCVCCSVMLRVSHILIKVLLTQWTFGELVCSKY